MKALIFHDIGEPNAVLHLEEIEEPIPATDEVLLQALFSPVNPSDLHMIRGRYGYQPPLPASPGGEGVGVVVKVGSQVTEVRAGESRNLYRRLESMAGESYMQGVLRRPGSRCNQR